jgi:RNA polymerase sigma-70 factor (ECF subfamily)
MRQYDGLEASPLAVGMRGQMAVETSGPGFFDWVTRLVHQHRARLVRVVRREGLGSEDALDCVQDAFYGFLTLPQARLLVEEPDDSAKLLTVLAKNVARNRRRRHDRSRPHFSDEITLEALEARGASADQVVAEAQEYALVVGCMATLNQMQRAVVTLRLLDGSRRERGADARHFAGQRGGAPEPRQEELA